MQTILANRFTSIVELKRSPSKVINSVEEQPVAVLSHNTPKAYIISPNLFERMIDALDEQKLVATCKERLQKLDTAVEVDIDEL